METRAYACEVVAWRFVTQLSEREAIDYLLYELPSPKSVVNGVRDAEAGRLSGAANRVHDLNGFRVNSYSDRPDSRTGLLQSPATARETQRTPSPLRRFGTAAVDDAAVDEDGEFIEQFLSLNALEIAAVSGAKKFLSQRVVQRIVHAIWSGKIIFWETLSVDSKKEAKLYNKRYLDFLPSMTYTSDRG